MLFMSEWLCEYLVDFGRILSPYPPPIVPARRQPVYLHQ